MDKSAFEQLKSSYHDLPLFEELEREFEITLIEGDKCTLNAILRRVRDAFEPVLHFLTGVLHPDANSFSDIYEYRCFTEQDKDKILTLYKRLMALSREFLEAEIMKDATLDIQLIKASLKEWKEIKPDVLPFVRRLKEHWKTSTLSQDQIDYMG